jgi:signal transduction histidine kinase
VYLETDPTTFISAINNLLENAIKYSPEKTAISSWTLQHTGNAISIKVADQGYGIAEDERERIFR